MALRVTADRGVRAAIVGAGLMGRWHAREAGRAGGAVVGVCDVDLAAAEHLARSHDGALAFGNYDTMLAHAVPDVVHVCTPPASHVDLAQRALQFGAHTIVEKPVAATAMETEQLLRVAQSSGRLVCPVHQYPFQRSIRSAVGALSELEPLLDLSYVACSAGATGAAEEDTVVADILAHPLSVVQRLLPVNLGQLDWNASRPHPGELRASTEVRGASVRIAVSTGGRPTRNELRLIGAGGTLHADLFHDFAVREPSAVSRARKITRPFAFSAATGRAATLNLARRTLQREPAYPGLRALIAAVYEYACAGGRPPITHDECVAVARARDRLLSIAGG